MTQLTKNFTLEEFENSSTAKKYNINNTIPDKYKKHTSNLAELLQTIRDAWGAPIIVSSGYRCTKLNSIVGGAKNSDHMYAAAADIHTKTDTLEDNYKLWKMIDCMIKQGKIKCRQFIWEYGKKGVGPDWIHISVNHRYNGYKENQYVYIGV